MHELLNYLGALDDDGNLTQIGTVMSDFLLTLNWQDGLRISTVQMQQRNFAITSMLSVPVHSSVHEINRARPMQRRPDLSRRWNIDCSMHIMLSSKITKIRSGAIIIT